MDVRDATLCLKSLGEDGIDFTSLTVPVNRASTIVFPTVEEYQKRRQAIYDGYSYGLYGTPTSRALEHRIALIEGAARTLVLPSGFAAITLTTLACVQTGQRVLFPDSTYDTVRPFAEQFLAGLGICSSYYDPMIGAGIADLLEEDVALVWVESPGSMTLEVQDVPAIVQATHKRGIKVAADNTWATPLRFKPLAHQVDFSVYAISKYLGGHSDVVMGSISMSDPALYRRLKDFSRYMGYGVSADESSLVLRGIETLAIRLDRCEQTALRLARWVAEQSPVVEVRYPALPTNPGHYIWKRDFSGGTGLFSIFLAPWARPFLAEAVESLELFAIGASWGGTRSVVAVLDRPPVRTATVLAHEGPIIRLSIGLEDAEDLHADLARAFALLKRRHDEEVADDRAVQATSL
ncbi:MAG: PLP-dependent aspartate aminotransferase family protein [Sphingomicrobium sp.]|nr:PLP-dependent transferase [Sphingomonadales bacterium]